jgi:hypothetical protein
MSNIIALQTASRPAPSPVNGKVPPRRRKNGEVRTREDLTAEEIERLMEAAGRVGRHRHRVTGLSS